MKREACFECCGRGWVLAPPPGYERETVTMVMVTKPHIATFYVDACPRCGGSKVEAA